MTPDEQPLRQQLLAGLPIKQHTYELAGIATPIIEAGEGPPLVLLHGPGEHAAKWFRILPALAASYRVIAPDLPGHGASQLTGTLDTERTLTWLEELIARTCNTAPIVVGQLLGGAIAARFATRHSDRLACLVLVDTFGLGPFQPAGPFMAALTAFMMDPTEGTYDGLWRHCAFDLDRVRREVGTAWDRLRAYNLDRAHDASLRGPQEALMQQFGLPAMAPAELEAIRTPTLLIWGRNDLATRLDVAKAARDRYGWPLFVIDEAGDDPPIEQPDRFVRVLRSALSMPAWDLLAPGYDRTNTPTQMWLAELALRTGGLQAGMRVLDVAAGSGALSIPAARAGAHVVAIDQSRTMLELLRARARSESLAIETRVMDAHALELDANTFDIAASQFGVMLLPDMPAALREMVRVTRPGGRVIINAYGNPRDIEFLGFFVTAVRAVRPGFEGPPTDPPPLEFQLSDPARLRDELAAAGLTNVEVNTVTEQTEFASGDALWSWVVSSNPIVEHLLAMLQITDDERKVIRRHLDTMIRDRAGQAHTATLTDPVHIGIGTK